MSIFDFSDDEIVDAIAEYGIGGARINAVFNRFETNANELQSALPPLMKRGLLVVQGGNVMLGVEALIPRLVGKSEDDLRPFLKGSKS